MAKRASTASAAALRTRLAQEAARIIAEQGIADYGQAKRKAAARLGVGEASVLPSNAQIEECLAERQRIFEPELHAQRLRLLRVLALELMRWLTPFEPRLAGPVLTGTATANAEIELHLFADAPEAVATYLLGRGIRARDYQKRFRLSAKESASVPGFSISASGETVLLLIFPVNGLRQAPLSPIDQRPMRRASETDVLSLLA
jgi:hypothetical protein